MRSHRGYNGCIVPAVTPPNNRHSQQHSTTVAVNPSVRIRIIYSLLLLIITIFIIRLFYLQVIRHDYYRKAALQSQLKQYEIPAERGVIYAHDGDARTPLVLNEKKYTLYADPVYVKDPAKQALAISGIIGGDAGKIQSLLEIKNTRYVVLGKKLSKEQSKKLEDLGYPGVGTREETFRTYPEGTLAAQIVGFVNGEGKGQYGIEETLNNKLTGIPGSLKAITDSRGVPLASNAGNVLKEPKKGETVTLTIDVNMQRIAEEKLKEGLEKVESKRGSVIIMDTKSGAIKAMASYPSYDPAQYEKVEDASAFSNAAVSDELEPGSIMKPLTIAAALDAGVINTNFTYNNTGTVVVDGLTIKNSRLWSIPEENLQGIMQRSLNTGVVAVIAQAGKGVINADARHFWYKYMTEHYYFGKSTGIEQTAEAAGSIPAPDKGYALNFQYANTSFGQGLGVSLVQMAAAASAVFNGGTYWAPHVVEQPNKSYKVKEQVVSKAASDEVVNIMTKVAKSNYTNALHDGFMVGGKTGTAEIAGPNGKYYSDRFNGTFLGFVGGNVPEYAIVVVSHEPNVGDRAGIAAAQPIFSSITQALIASGVVAPIR